MKRQTHTALEAILGDLEPAEKKKAERRRRADYKGERNWDEVAVEHGKPTTYRLSPETAEAVKQAAEEHGVKVAVMAEVLLRYGLDALQEGRLAPPKG